MSVDNRPAGLSPLPPVFLFASLVLMLGLHFGVPVAHLFAYPWSIVYGVLALFLGVALNLWANRLFKRAGTAVKPFEPSTILIECGPFAFTRNPMYLGMVLILAGVALALRTLSPWLVIPIFVWQVSRRFVLPEERKLEAEFGPRYSRYKARVRRWL